MNERDTLFGSSVRTEVLCLLAMLEESFPSELARVLGKPVRSIQNVVDAFEDMGLVVGITRGRERRIRLNPRYRAAVELKALLDRLGDFDPRLQELAATVRTRPRTKGKPL